MQFTPALLIGLTPPFYRWAQRLVIGSGPLGCHVTACGGDQAGLSMLPVLLFLCVAIF
jgi:hypothetical protein